MSSLRPLRGRCQCGRNRYIIAIPEDGAHLAQVLFHTEPIHQVPLATPLAAYIRVPLSWYQSTTHAYLPDETHSMIRRVYEHPGHQDSKRHFCGFCGTPLSYWSERPHTEADYIRLTLGSLLREDMTDLEDMGLMPESESDEAGEEGGHTTTTIPPERETSLHLRESFGVPWFDSMVEGSRLGNMRRRQGIERSQDGTSTIEWEVVEYSNEGDQDVEMASTPSAKRKRPDLDETRA